LEFTKVQELIYNLPIEQVMNRQVITVDPATTISQLKELMRTKRISGVPILDDGNLVGIVSIANLIEALEAGELNAPVSQRMTTRLITVMEKESIIEAVKKFSVHGVGRLLVINEKGGLTGILTGNDITKGLLNALSLNYQNIEGKRHDSQLTIFREDVVSDHTSLYLRYSIKAKDFKSGGSASSKIKRAIRRLGISPPILRRVNIASYEAEMNLIIHTDQGGELTAEIRPDLIRITATDSGPGIPDVEKALLPGFSTAPPWITELGFGAGMGLANIKKCADSFSLKSTPGKGTKLDVLIYWE
jgi:CBS domain-containing protein/anti-sigma regulatory factor (Ser/Thr protein kinase)